MVQLLSILLLLGEEVVEVLHLMVRLMVAEVVLADLELMLQDIH
jgi:hypothetical protein